MGAAHRSAARAWGARPVPFRTRKLSPIAPRVLRGKPVGGQGAADRWTAPSRSVVIPGGGGESPPPPFFVPGRRGRRGAARLPRRRRFPPTCGLRVPGSLFRTVVFATSRFGLAHQFPYSVMSFLAQRLTYPPLAVLCRFSFLRCRMMLWSALRSSASFLLIEVHYGFC